MDANRKQPERPSESPLLVKPIDAAALLSVSRATVGALVRAGAIPRVPIGTGREYRIPLAALKDWIKANGGDAVVAQG